MKLFRLQAVHAVTLVAGMAFAAHSEVLTFDKETKGALPQGWQERLVGEGQPKWSLEAEATAPSLPFVLKQSGWSPNPSFPLCLLTNTSIVDGFVQVHFKPLGGTNDQAAGVVWRAMDERNYYIARANALENNVVLYKVRDGKRQALDIVGRKGGYGVKAEVRANTWGTLRVDFEGTRFRVVLNGNELFEVEDATFTETGKVGVWTKADSVVLFDSFEWERKN